MNISVIDGNLLWLKFKFQNHNTAISLAEPLTECGVNFILVHLIQYLYCDFCPSSTNRPQKWWISFHRIPQPESWIDYIAFSSFLCTSSERTHGYTLEKHTPKCVFRRNPFIYLPNQFSMKSNNNAREKRCENIWTGANTTDVCVTLFALPSIDGANEKVSHFKQEYLPILPIWKYYVRRS